MAHSHNNSVIIKKDELQILINMIGGQGINLEICRRLTKLGIEK